jgi:hypothetical protein
MPMQAQSVFCENEQVDVLEQSHRQGNFHTEDVCRHLRRTRGPGSTSLEQFPHSTNTHNLRIFQHGWPQIE